MSQKSKILVIDNKKETQELLKRILGEYDIDYAHNLEETLENIAETSYELILIAITQIDLGGYELAQAIKESEKVKKNQLIIFLADYKQQEAIIPGMTYCDINSIIEPFGQEIFSQHINHFISQKSDYKKLSNELTVVTDTMLQMVSENARVYDICRFLQKSVFCKDVHALCEQLFNVTNGFGLKASLSVHTERNHFFVSSTDEAGQVIHNDILEMVKDEDRIFHFGNDRAVFNWESASLLVDKLRTDVDILAMLMDGFENGLKAIESVDDFNQVLDKYRKQTHLLNAQVADVVDDVGTCINDEITNFGSGTELTIEQEESLMKIATEHREKVDQLFKDGLNLDEELSDIINKMRTDGVEEKEKEDDDDGIDFF